MLVYDSKMMTKLAPGLRRWPGQWIGRVGGRMRRRIRCVESRSVSRGLSLDSCHSSTKANPSIPPRFS